MGLTPGTRLGAYEVTAQIGEGGMGQVFRATDTKLKRQVAIKILPPSLAADPERLARFQREAEVLASLNHPHIAGIYGLEDTGGLTALVMEFVEGEDLSQRLARGAIPIDEALPIAKQIAEALEAAHEQGIIHRDLKPANIKVRADGTVKVLDFGLAKAFEPVGAASGSGNVSVAPTITTPAMSQAGIILGTAAYMSPEQARGKPLDKRADIWAFGAVLFEMLTAQRAFPGEDLSLTLAAVVMQEPAWATLPPATAPNVRQLLRRCLTKDPRQRIRDMGDVRQALEHANDAAPAPDPQDRQTLRTQVWALAATAVIAIAASALAAWALFNRPTVGDTTSVRLSIPLRPQEEVTTYPAITRDGHTVAYVTQQGTDDPILYLRDLNSFEVRPVPNSNGAKQPFFSPDGKWVAFFAQGQLQKAEVAGGAPITLAEAADSRGGTWNEDDTIVFAASLGSGLSQISARGGRPTSLTKPDGAAQGYSHALPQALPGGRRVLFTVTGQTQGNAILSLDSRQWQVVLPLKTFRTGMFDALRGTTGRLLVPDSSAGVMAAPFDVAHPAPTSADTTVLTNVYYDVEYESRPWLAVSDTRTAIYVAGNPGKTSLVWTDREGRIEPLGKEQDIYREVSLSPDGTKAVVRQFEDLWIHDLKSGTRRRLLSGTASFYPFWSVDGSRIVFGSNRAGDWNIYSQLADGSGSAEDVINQPGDQLPYGMLPDGTLLYLEIQAKTGRDLWTRSPDGKTTPFVVTSSNEGEGRFSPGGSSDPGGERHWIAYASDETGRYEIYLKAYPLDGSPVVPVSSGGGTQPRWSADGKELFYVTGDAVVAVTVQPDGTVSAPRRLFDRSAFYLSSRTQTYQAAKDGRFLMIRRDEGAVPRRLNVITNWREES